jgi:ATP/maltotriose-dependent transcriptional regulator MalT
MVALSSALAGMMGDDLDRADAAAPALAEHPDPWVRAIGRIIASVVEIFRGDAEAAEAGFADALAQTHAIGDRWAQATLYGAVGEMRAMRGDGVGALEAFRSGARMAEELGVPEVAAGAVLTLVLHEERTGDVVSARRHLARAREYAGRGVSAQLSVALTGAEAEIEYRSGRLQAARTLFRSALEIAVPATARGIAREITGTLLHGLAHTEIALGDLDAAKTYAADIHALSEGPVPVGRIGMALCASIVMSVAVAEGDAVRAARVAGMGTAIRGTVDTGTPEVRVAVAAARSALGSEAFEKAYAEGAVLGYDDAVAELLH